MELQHLRAFVEISRHRNLTRAADHLHISPSALSSQIKLLEAHLGVDLFIRSPKGMQLTDPGRDLLAHADATIQAAERLCARAREMTGKPPETLNIGMNTDPAFLKMSAMNEALCEALPDMAIRYKSSTTLETARMLRRRMIHVGFVFGDYIAKDVAVKQLASVDINVVIPATMFDRPPALDWKEISRLPWIWGEARCPCHFIFEDLLKKHKVELNKVGYAVDEKITKQLVRDGKGVALMRCDDARDLESAGQAYIWPPGTIQVPFGLACLSERKNSPAIGAAVSAVVQVWDRQDTAPAAL